jgi:hypothetical protein
MQKTTSKPSWNFKDIINMDIREILYEHVAEVVQKEKKNIYLNYLRKR